jgi:predicted ATPase
MSSKQTAKLQARIQSVTIQGFRCLRDIQQLELPQLAVFIGGNGAGKSTLIRFFEMLGWMMKSRNLREFVLRNGGADDQLFLGGNVTPQIHAKLVLTTDVGTNEYRFDLVRRNANDDFFGKNEAFRFSDKALGTSENWQELTDIGLEASLPDQTDKTAQTILHLLTECATLQFHDTSPNAKLHTRRDVSDCFRLRNDGGNLAVVLLNLRGAEPRRYTLIVQQIQRVLPQFQDFVLDEEYGKVLLRWRTRHADKIIGSHLTSDGSLRLFCLITLLNLPEQQLPDILMFDEPELGLHPHAMTLVAAMIKRVAQTKQVFLATQSPYFVDCFDLENIIIASNQGGETRLRNLSVDQYRQWLGDDYGISDIWLEQAITADGIGAILKSISSPSAGEMLHPW